MKNGKLYNIMFPIWFIFTIPLTWLIVIPANFLINTIVLIAGLKYLKIDKAYETYKKIILKVWIIGVICNVIASGILFLANFDNNSLYNAVKSNIVWNPFSSILSVATVIVSIIISMVLLYLFNYTISFKKVGLERKKAKKLSLIVAIATAPWLLLFPTTIVYNNASTNIASNVSTNELKSVEISEALNSLGVSVYIEGGVFDSNDLKLSVNCNISTNDEKKIKEYQNLFESNDTDKLLNENAGQLFSKINYINDVVFKVSDDKTYTFNREDVK